MAEHRGISYLFEEVTPIFREADAVVVNLECPLTDTVSPVNKKYIFRADARWAKDLKEAGITIPTIKVDVGFKLRHNISQRQESPH